VAGKAASYSEGIELAARSINSGKALDALEKLIQVSNAGG